MPSGTFLVGENLSMEGFRQYVEPTLQKRGYSVPDRLVISNKNWGTNLLISVVGAGDVERGINEGLVEAAEAINRVEGQKRHSQNVYSHQIAKTDYEDKGGKRIPIPKGMYEVIGIYKSDKGASELFPTIAQEHLIEGVEAKARELGETIEDLFGKRE